MNEQTLHALSPIIAVLIWNVLWIIMYKWKGVKRMYNWKEYPMGWYKMAPILLYLYNLSAIVWFLIILL